MTDYFSLFGIERRPAIQENILKQAYLKRSKEPANDEDLALLHLAFQTLSNPASRLQHLEKVEFGKAGDKQIPAGLGQLFSTIASSLQEVDLELSSLNVHRSAIQRAVAMQKLGPVRHNLRELENRLSEEISTLIAEVPVLDTAWVQDPARCREPLAQLALALTFIQKWLSQVRERSLKIEEVA
ncbi:MAG: hypothetical protein JOY96_11900 [Verrucomicrobia bacterium]|nr:hypothetical protein [Verrucomicrobiota bacterium]